MTYDEFTSKLETIKAEYYKAYGKKLETIIELENYMDLRLGRKRTKGLKSLKGLRL